MSEKTVSELIAAIPATVNPAQKPGNAPRVPADALDAVTVIDDDNVVSNAGWCWNYDEAFLAVLRPLFKSWEYSTPGWVEFHQLVRCQQGYVFVTPKESGELRKLARRWATRYRKEAAARRAR
jgi:hypothetical protein